VSFYKYTILGNGEIPSAPILDIKIISLDKNNIKTVNCSAFLDTGSDCTLIPLNFLAQIQAKVASSLTNIQVTGLGGKNVTVYPYYVSIVIDRYTIPLVKVYGCAIEDTNGIGILGRDILNRLCIKFDGNREIFTFLDS
jgi:hypothetical protein